MSDNKLDDKYPKPELDTKKINRTNKNRFTLIIVAVIICLLTFFIIIIKNSSNINKTSDNKLELAEITQKPIPVENESPNSLTTEQEKQKITFISNDALYIANLDGSNKKLIYKPEIPDPYISWDISPDGNKIVTSGQIIDINTGDSIKVPNDRCQNWSPDGKRIIYGVGVIYMMGSNGQNSIKINSGSLCRGSNDIHRWSPDSKSFFYTNEEGVNKFDITNNKNNLIINSDKALSVSVSHNSKYITFMEIGERIYTANSDGTNIQSIQADNQLEPSDSMFSFNDNEIIFSTNNSNNVYNGLSSFNLTSKTVKVISPAQASSYYPPDLSNDGNFVSYDAVEGNQLKTIIIDLENGKKIKLPFSMTHVIFSK